MDDNNDGVLKHAPIPPPIKIGVSSGGSLMKILEEIKENAIVSEDRRDAKTRGWQSIQDQG
jgi:hypothetical protein